MKVKTNRKALTHIQMNCAQAEERRARAGRGGLGSRSVYSNLLTRKSGTNKTSRLLLQPRHAAPRECKRGCVTGSHG